MGFNVRSYKVLQHLYHPLTLSICLRMKRSTEWEICSEQVEESSPELSSKPGIPIKYNHFWKTVQSEDRINEDLGIFHGGDLFARPSKVNHFCQFINKDCNSHESA